MNKMTITLSKLDGVVVNTTPLDSTVDNLAAALTLNAELMQLGYIMSETLLTATKQLSNNNLTLFAQELITTLRQRKGAHINYTPMYPNFPRQVIDISDMELYLNAITHYWSLGQWLPDTDKLPRHYAFEATKFQEIALTTDNQVKGIFTALLASNDSLSDTDKKILEWFMLNLPKDQRIFPEVIPFAENKCVVAAIMLAQSQDISPLVKSATDILRIATYLSEGDISLATNTTFISLPRQLRKNLSLQLERVINEEDIGRHRNKWVRLFHNLHVGDYSKKVYSIAKNGQKQSNIRELLWAN
ncbi:hypothetical protein A9Q99_12970 [Gammaproteobacteria bacterium 45_16_T64]|nr:hypothetical protein A9Q99_12970 [Gammaproteobacteria bacterium 45_16_T64]